MPATTTVNIQRTTVTGGHRTRAVIAGGTGIPVQVDPMAAQIVGMAQLVPPATLGSVQVQWVTLTTVDANDQPVTPKPDIRVGDELIDASGTVNPWTNQPLVYYVQGVEDWGTFLVARAAYQQSASTT